MKLPKGLGNMGALLKQAQEAMQRAKQLDEELKLEEIEAEKNGVKVKYNGAGEILSVKVSAELIDPEDIETLEDAILLALREGYKKSLEIRERKLKEITGDLPLPPGANPF